MDTLGENFKIRYNNEKRGIKKLKKDKDKIFVERVDVHTLTDFKPSYVKCIQTGNITEFVCLAKSPAPFPVVKIDKDHYVVLETGELLEYEHSENKSQNLQTARRTLANLRRKIV